MGKPQPERKRILSRQKPLPQRMGSYHILSRLAEGGMGTVYFGRHSVLGGMAAIKVLKAERQDSAEIVARFQKEAQALARVEHENVVQVLDVGEEEGHVFIAMELAQGMDLRRWLKRDGKLAPENFVYVAKQVVSGVAAAHEAGVLHRDIKPDNVIVNQHGAVKITDFGLADDARMLAGGTERQTFATIAYAAPEVLSGQRSDGRSDVFSLAATLWHVATGEMPFGKESRAAVMAQQREPLPNLRELIPEMPAPLAKAIMLGLRYQASERPADALAFEALAFPTKSGGIWDWPLLGAAASLLLVVSLAAVAIFGGEDAAQPKPKQAPISKEPAPDIDKKTPEATLLKTIEGPPMPRDLVVAEVREQAAQALWQELAPRVNALVEHPPAQLLLLFDFVKTHRATRAAAEAARTFDGIAAPFERARREAFANLKSALEVASLDQQPALLAAFPAIYLERIEGLSLESDLNKDYDALLAQVKKAELERSEQLLASIKEQDTSFGPAAALCGLQASLLPPARIAPHLATSFGDLRKDLEARVQRAYESALREDDDYLKSLATAQVALAKRLEERVISTSQSVWRAGPSSNDTREWAALKTLAARLAPALEAPLTRDLALTQEAYRWLAEAINANKGLLLNLPRDPDLAPSFGQILDGEELTILEAKDHNMSFEAIGEAKPKSIALRSLDIESWRKLAAESKAYKTEYLQLRVAQIIDQASRESWQRELSIENNSLQPLSETLATIRAMQNAQGDPSLRWRGYLAGRLHEPDALLDIRRTVLDATSASLDPELVLRVWRMAPESYRVLRALARLALDERIPADSSKEVQEALAKASQHWQDRILWQWAQKQGG